MDKPTSLVIQETKTKLADIINSSGLPPFVIEPILSDFLNESRIAVQRQYEIEKAQYEQFLLEEKSKQEDMTK